MITKEAKEKWATTKNLWFFESARFGFEVLLNTVMSGRDDVILMPGYIGQTVSEGSGVFDPIRNTKTKYVFYSLNADLSVNVDDLKGKMNNPNVKAVLVIHYFGFPQKCVVELAEMCNKKGVLLIEDCAHTIGGQYKGIQLGGYGDFSFYSIHKLTAAMNGGILRVNNPAYIDCFRKIKDNINIGDLLQFNRTDFETVSKIRRYNYEFYLGKLNRESIYFDIMYPCLEDGVVPINFPIKVKNYSREKMYFQLREEGVLLVSLYYQMIDELPRKQFPISFDVSNTILNLPTHQCICEDDLLTIIEALNHFEPKVNGVRFHFCNKK